MNHPQVQAYLREVTQGQQLHLAATKAHLLQFLLSAVDRLALLDMYP